MTNTLARDITLIQTENFRSNFVRPKYIYLMLAFACTAFIVGTAWALLRASDGSGYAGCGMRNYRVDEESISVTFTHYGWLRNTGNGPIYADFLAGSAIYPDNYDDGRGGGLGYGDANDHTQVDFDTITRQPGHNWIRSGSTLLQPEKSIGWFRETTVSNNDDGLDPGKWWVAGVTYTQMAEQPGAGTFQMRVVSEYDIVSPGSAREVLYREATEWHSKGYWAPWPPNL